MAGLSLMSLGCCPMMHGSDGLVKLLAPLILLLNLFGCDVGILWPSLLLAQYYVVIRMIAYWRNLNPTFFSSNLWGFQNWSWFPCWFVHSFLHFESWVGDTWICFWNWILFGFVLADFEFWGSILDSLLICGSSGGTCCFAFWKVSIFYASLRFPWGAVAAVMFWGISFGWFLGYDGAEPCFLRTNIEDAVRWAMVDADNLGQYIVDIYGVLRILGHCYWACLQLMHCIFWF